MPSTSTLTDTTFANRILRQVAQPGCLPKAEPRRPPLRNQTLSNPARGRAQAHPPPILFLPTRNLRPLSALVDPRPAPSASRPPHPVPSVSRALWDKSQVRSALRPLDSPHSRILPSRSQPRARPSGLHPRPSLHLGSRRLASQHSVNQVSASLRRAPLPLARPPKLARQAPAARLSDSPRRSVRNRRASAPPRLVSRHNLPNRALSARPARWARSRVLSGVVQVDQVPSRLQAPPLPPVRQARSHPQALPPQLVRQARSALRRNRPRHPVPSASRPSRRRRTLLPHQRSPQLAPAILLLLRPPRLSPEDRPRTPSSRLPKRPLRSASRRRALRRPRIRLAAPLPRRPQRQQQQPHLLGAITLTRPEVRRSTLTSPHTLPRT